MEEWAAKYWGEEVEVVNSLNLNHYSDLYLEQAIL